MDLKQLNYFLCLAREGNMTRAARQLNIVQPALSMQIAKLEKSFGKQLFDRAAHGVSLTPAGETLVRLAGTTTKEVERAREEMARLDGKISGRVSIGMIASAAQSTLAASSAKIAARYPEIQLLICEGYRHVDRLGGLGRTGRRHHQHAAEEAYADGASHPRRRDDAGSGNGQQNAALQDDFLQAA